MLLKVEDDADLHENPQPIFLSLSLCGGEEDVEFVNGQMGVIIDWIIKKIYLFLSLSY